MDGRMQGSTRRAATSRNALMNWLCSPRGCSSPFEASVAFLTGLAHVSLRVELNAELVDQIELGLEEVDVALLVGHQRLEQVARGIILYGRAIGRGLLV